MWIVPKGKKGKKLIGIRTLRDDEKLSLISLICHDGGVRSQIQGRNLLAQIHEREFWIECDCKDRGRPLMAPVRRGNGTITLKRMTSRYLHETNCPFKEIEYGDNQLITLRSPITQKKELRLHLRFSEWINQPGKSPKNHKVQLKTKSITLARILNTWMELAKLNEIHATRHSISEQYQALHDVICDYSLADGIPVSRFFSTYPFHYKSVIPLLKESISEWPAMVRPHAVFVVAADQYVEKKLICYFKGNCIEIPFEGPVYFSSMRMGQFHGPLIAIFTITDSTERPNYFVPWKAYIRPIYSKQILCPVDSRYERNVLKEIIFNWLPWWKGRGLDIKIKKPLLSIDTNSDVQVVPDLIFEVNGRRVFLEIMGSEDEEYKMKKSHTIPLMQKHGKVFEFNAFQAEKKGAWNKNLESVLKMIAEELFQKDYN